MYKTGPTEQQLETHLPDGYKVTLNANSNLRYHSRNLRKLWLEGETYFITELDIPSVKIAAAILCDKDGIYMS